MTGTPAAYRVRCWLVRQIDELEGKRERWIADLEHATERDVLRVRISATTKALEVYRDHLLAVCVPTDTQNAKEPMHVQDAQRHHR